jgi:hypothetical protein
LLNTTSQLPNAATITLLNLAQTYDGTPRTVAATTVPAGLAVSLTYNGSASAPVNAGSYAVVASVTDPDYQGGVTNLLVVGVAPITLRPGPRHHGAFQFTFTNSPGVSFTVFTATSPATPAANWATLGAATEITPGVYQFTDASAARDPRRFYRVGSL